MNRRDTDIKIWRQLSDPRTPKQRKADDEAMRERQARCVHRSMAHRNDGKISECRICGYIRDNEL